MLLLPKAHAAWLRKSSKDKSDYYYVVGHCLKLNGQSWLATADGYRLHALAVDLEPGAYYLDREGIVHSTLGEKLLEWSILVSRRYQESFPMERPKLTGKTGTLDQHIFDLTQDGSTYVNKQHLKDAFSLAKHAMVSIPVDPLPGIRISFNPGVNQAFAILTRMGGTGVSTYPPQSLKYAK